MRKSRRRQKNNGHVFLVLCYLRSVKECVEYVEYIGNVGICRNCLNMLTRKDAGNTKGIAYRKTRVRIRKLT